MRKRSFIFAIQIFILCVVVFIIGICVTGFHRKPSTADSEHTKYFTSITIEEGDTLWSIAEKNVTPEYKDMEEYIREVKNINHLKEDGMITAGRHIVIPHYTTE